MTDALAAAFGPGGKVYQKNRDADATGAAASGMGSTSASGSHTPIGGSHSQRGHMRQAGAMTIHEAKPPKRTESGKGKEREKIWDLPKSKEVKRLEGIIARLKDAQAGEGKVKADDTVPPCFCQGKLQRLSIGTTRGLTLQPGITHCRRTPPTAHTAA